MISLTLFVLMVRYICISLQGNTLVLSIFLFGFFLGVNFLRKFTPVTKFLNKLDSKLFNTYLFQSLLQTTILFETLWMSTNFFISLGCFFIYVFLLNCYLVGLSCLSQPLVLNDLLDLKQLFSIALALWLTFYLKLRMTSLNYYNLEIDSTRIPWNDLISKFIKSQDLEFRDRFPIEMPVSLISFKHKSVVRLKAAFRLPSIELDPPGSTSSPSFFQKRGLVNIPGGIKKAAERATKEASREAAKAASDNTGSTGAVVAASIGAGAMVYVAKENQKIAHETNAVQAKQVEAAERQNDIQQSNLEYQKEKDAAVMEFEKEKFRVEMSLRYSESASVQQAQAKSAEIRQNLKDQDRMKQIDKANREDLGIASPEAAKMPSHAEIILDSIRDVNGNLILVEPPITSPSAKSITSSPVEDLPNPIQNSKGKVNLDQPSLSPPPTEGLKKGVKDLSATETNFPSVVRLDGSCVEDIISYFL